MMVSSVLSLTMSHLEHQRRDQNLPRQPGALSEYALFRLFLLMTETQ
jgi:hypothetical protein